MRIVLGVLVLGATVSTVFAGTATDAHVKLRVSTPTTIEATVDGMPAADVEHVALHAKADPELAIHPAHITTCAESNVPVAIAIMYPENTFWIGTDQVATDPDEKYDGRMETVAPVFDQVSFAAKLPPGSKFAMISYGARATTRVPWSPIAQLRSAAFGSQADYQPQNDVDFNAGLVAALDELERSGAPRQVLLSFDGDDFREPTEQVSAAVDKAQRRGVVVYSLATASDLHSGSSSGHRRTDLHGVFALTNASAAKVTNSSDGARHELEAYRDAIATNCWYATFDVGALHGAQDVAVTIDGKDAELTSDGKPIDFVHVLLAPERFVWWTSRLLQIGVGLLLVALVALALRWRFRAPAR